MQNVTPSNFGPLIAYFVPGLTVIVGASQFSPTLQNWIGTGTTDSPTIGGFLYLTIAALAVGMTVSAVRWVVVDTIHNRTGLRIPPFDFSKLGTNVDAYTLLIRIHYDHYMFYSNMCLALFLAYVCYRVKLGSVLSISWLDAGFVVLEIVFFVTSRNTLGNYYLRTQQLLSAGQRR